MDLSREMSGVFRISFSRRFTLEDIPHFMALVVPLERAQVKGFVLDMERLEVIDISAIKHLGNFLKTQYNSGRKVSTINAPARIREVCQIKNIEMYFDNTL